jgi:hypothetical protein
MATVAPEISIERRTSVTFPVVLGWVVIAFAALIAVVRFVGSDPAESGPDAVLASLALGGVIATPGILALLSRDGRVALLVPAAIGLALVCTMSVATLPLIIAAAFLVVAFAGRPAADRQGFLLTAATTVTVLVLLVAAALALFVHQDPRSWTSETGSGSTSDVITAAEALISLGLSAAAILVGRFLATARPR